MEKHLVFVYGSLKRGFGNHCLLETSTFLESTRTLSRRFKMASLSFFPGVVKTRLGTPSYAIEGELYEVDQKTFEALDRLEGNGRFYNREKILLANGQEAWMYLLMDKGRGELFSKVCPRVKNTRNHTQRWLESATSLDSY